MFPCIAFAFFIFIVHVFLPWQICYWWSSTIPCYLTYVEAVESERRSALGIFCHQQWAIEWSKQWRDIVDKYKEEHCTKDISLGYSRKASSNWDVFPDIETQFTFNISNLETMHFQRLSVIAMTQRYLLWHLDNRKSFYWCNWPLL